MTRAEKLLKQRQREAARRDDRRQNGLCVMCGLRPPIEGTYRGKPRSRCRPCLDRVKAIYKTAQVKGTKARNARDRRQADKDRGICHQCREAPAEPPYVRCKACRDDSRERHYARFERRREAGLCILCVGKPTEDNPITSSGLCEQCRIAKNERHVRARTKRKHREMEAIREEQRKAGLYD